jgi:hypothetical protein
MKQSGCGGDRSSTRRGWPRYTRAPLSWMQWGLGWGIEAWFGRLAEGGLWLMDNALRRIARRDR